MSSAIDVEIPDDIQPQPEDYDFDLEQALKAVVGITSHVPEDAFTAEILGTERIGNGVLIEGGVVLTIGYLITEAETIWLSLSDGRAVQGHALAYDQETGFGLVQPLARLSLRGLPLGDASAVRLGSDVVVAGAGGRVHSVAANIVGRQEFAGYWEYVLDEALFTAPAHPQWGGTAVLDESGRVIGIGSLQLQAASEEGHPLPLNMAVPTNILAPVLDDLRSHGRRRTPARPWLGIYGAGIENKVVVIGLASGGPAEEAGVQSGDIVRAVAGEAVSDLAEFYRKVWALGEAGVLVPLTLERDRDRIDLAVTSTDRNLLFKSPRLH
ncbi:MAG: S1C family serine protease [Methyloligellaceae bacterium]